KRTGNPKRTGDPKRHLKVDQETTMLESTKITPRYQLATGLLAFFLAGLVAWRKTQVWWPGLTGLDQFWLLPEWQVAGQFLVGWSLAMVGLKLDEQNSWRWYQTTALTRSVSFAVVLLVIGSVVIPTTSNAVGSGIILGLWTQLATEVLIWQTDQLGFRQKFLHDIKLNLIDEFEKTWNGKWGAIMGLGLLVLVILMLI
ncbi:MAG TPA: hypothetical protein DEP87_00615, partial [Candidatus Pacebacteria bacterium]|nr:hypothetical protein [Candidatus Paceibacterota bacterium]